MKFLSFEARGLQGLAVDCEGRWMGLSSDHVSYPGDLQSLLVQERLASARDVLQGEGKPIDVAKVKVLPPIIPSKILCVGLNYADHAAESSMENPKFPTLFSRFASSIIGADQPIRLPRVSAALDFEGELAVIVGKRGRYISRGDALSHVAGYSVFNDASIRDYQLRTTQWMLGKNFDGTGPFGPMFVTADEIPDGARGLAIETRVNGKVMQRSSTDKLIFDVESLIVTISEAMDLEIGDLIATGTPAGVGAARKPPIFMKAGDICEVEIERVGLLRNTVALDD